MLGTPAGPGKATAAPDSPRGPGRFLSRAHPSESGRGYVLLVRRFPTQAPPRTTNTTTTIAVIRSARLNLVNRTPQKRPDRGYRTLSGAPVRFAASRRTAPAWVTLVGG